MSRYRHVYAMKAEGFPVAAACAAAEISASAYYEWLDKLGRPDRRRVGRGPARQRDAQDPRRRSTTPTGPRA